MTMSDPQGGPEPQETQGAPVDEGGSAKLNAVVTHRMEVAPGLIILRVAPVGWKLPEFTSGQYVVLGLPGAALRCPDSDPEQDPLPPGKLILRAYSIASSSRAREDLEFYLALVRSGTLTPRLFALRIGDPVHLGRKVTGMFTLDGVPPEAHVIFFATGTGIAPYMSMIRTALAADTRRRFAVVHCARHSWDLAYEAELITHQRLNPTFSYVPAITRPREEPIPWGGRVGYCQGIWTDRVIEAVWGFRPRPDNTHIFLCGNPAMIEAMVELLARDGFREHTRKVAGQVHLERYW
jgi:ferredoxin--NADP+ reductase